MMDLILQRADHNDGTKWTIHSICLKYQDPTSCHAFRQMQKLITFKFFFFLSYSDHLYLIVVGVNGYF